MGAVTPEEKESLSCALLGALAAAMLGFALFCGSASGQDADKGADLDLPVLPPTYRSPEERALQPIPDVSPPERQELPVEDTEALDEPVLFYGQEIGAEQSSVVYVLDFSESMGIYTTGCIIIQDSPTSTHTIPIFYVDRLKEEFAASVSALSANMRFNVIAFDCNVDQWSGGLVRATPGSKADAIAWVTDQQPRGATNTGAAVTLALQDPEVESVILLTDGMPTCPTYDWETHREVIRQNNPRHIPIHCFGLGNAGRRRSSPFLSAVAADSGGICVDVQ